MYPPGHLVEWTTRDGSRICASAGHHSKLPTWKVCELESRLFRKQLRPPGPVGSSPTPSAMFKNNKWRVTAESLWLAIKNLIRYGNVWGSQ